MLKYYSVAEISLSDPKIHDIGALSDDGAVCHGCDEE
jgi:hypothetical protein